MWLLDVNLPNGLVAALKEFGIDCDTTAGRGWRELENGELARAASAAGFTSILTRDRLFGESAGKALKHHPGLAVVIVTIPQSRSSLYMSEFRRHWGIAAIQPLAGRVIEWPTNQ